MRLDDMAAFLDRLGNPHRSAPVIHVAGTSGKGSTATAIASILGEAGYNMLLHTSPFLQVSTEKIQINGQLLDIDQFASLTDRVLVAASSFPGRITYGEAWIALVALAMAESRPDVAVIEVGAGGRFDLTNVVQPAVAVVTTIGLDHTESLGSTLPEIAWHKAGIIKPGASVVHAVTDPALQPVIDREIDAAGVGRVTVVYPDDLDVERDEDGGLSWRDPVTGGRLKSGIAGAPQVLNGAIAAAAARAFDPSLAGEVIAAGLVHARIAARFERVQENPTVILDGAHNPQKMAALVPDLESLPKPVIGLAGFLAAKRADEMLEMLVPALDGVILTAPEIEGKPGLDPAEASAMVLADRAIPVRWSTSIDQALDQALALAGATGSVIVTGSLYLCGAARERWYPSARIVAEGTQWPEH